jgi:hypothetical protein
MTKSHKPLTINQYDACIARLSPEMFEAATDIGKTTFIAKLLKASVTVEGEGDEVKFEVKAIRYNRKRGC